MGGSRFIICKSWMIAANHEYKEIYDIPSNRMVILPRREAIDNDGDGERVMSDIESSNQNLCMFLCGVWLF